MIERQVWGDPSADKYYEEMLSKRKQVKLANAKREMVDWDASVEQEIIKPWLDRKKAKVQGVKASKERAVKMEKLRLQKLKKQAAAEKIKMAQELVDDTLSLLNRAMFAISKQETTNARRKRYSESERNEPNAGDEARQLRKQVR